MAVEGAISIAVRPAARSFSSVSVLVVPVPSSPACTALQLALQNNQLMAKRGILRFKSAGGFIHTGLVGL
jgi:hypothetical protein